ncbi:hypothetical protein HZA55_10385 [Candidatus Poribacteria bacterium]|nr:hypothetical protein [Candidatus Poribacteria bacterium]
MNLDLALDKQTISIKIKTLLLNIVFSIIMFLFIYDISFIAAPSVTTGRLTVILLTACLFTHMMAELKNFVIENFLILNFFLFISIYSLALYLFNYAIDSTQFSRSFHFLFYSIYGSILFWTLLKKNVYKFVSIFSLATFIQSLFIAYSYISPGYRLWLSKLLVQGGNIPLTVGLRVPGFSNSSGAALSVIQALGVFASLYAANLSKSSFKVFFYSLIAIITLGSTVITGRTGLILAILFLLTFMINNIIKHNYKLFIFAILLIIIVLFYSKTIYINLQKNNTLKWAFEFFEKGTKTGSINELYSQYIPPLNFDTLIGTGYIVSGNKNASGNDSGYIQTYYALGLISASIFYISLISMLSTYIYFIKKKFLFIFITVTMFLTEFKEPFIYKYIFPFFTISLLYLQKQKISNENA